MTRLRNRLFVIAAFLAGVILTGGISDQAHAKPYACGNQTCGAQDANKCQKCTSAVCDKNGQGQEVLVPGTATVTKCEKPAASMDTGPTGTPPRNFQRAPVVPGGAIMQRGVEPETSQDNLSSPSGTQPTEAPVPKVP